MIFQVPNGINSLVERTSQPRGVASTLLRNKRTNTDGSSLSQFLLYSGVFDALKAMGVVEGPAFGKIHSPEPVLILSVGFFTFLLLLMLSLAHLFPTPPLNSGPPLPSLRDHHPTRAGNGPGNTKEPPAAE